MPNKVDALAAAVTGVLLPLLTLFPIPHFFSPEALAQNNSAPVALLGTGASFPAPLYELWFREYNHLHPEVQINFQMLGSGAGIKQFEHGLVDFAASDAAMTDQEIAAVKEGVVMLPMTAGSVVISYNIPGFTGELRLSRRAYA